MMKNQFYFVQTLLMCNSKREQELERAKARSHATAFAHKRERIKRQGQSQKVVVSNDEEVYMQNTNTHYSVTYYRQRRVLHPEKRDVVLEGASIAHAASWSMPQRNFERLTPASSDENSNHASHDSDSVVLSTAYSGSPPGDVFGLLPVDSKKGHIPIAFEFFSHVYVPFATKTSTGQQQGFLPSSAFRPAYRYCYRTRCFSSNSWRIRLRCKN